MLNYDELLLARHSVRDFQPKQISPEILQAILQDTCKAPSASNKQPWKFIVIQDRDIIKQLSDDSKRNLVTAIELDPNCGAKPYEKMLRDPNVNVFYNAPCLILIAAQTGPGYYHYDCTLAAAYLVAPE